MIVLLGMCFWVTYRLVCLVENSGGQGLWELWPAVDIKMTFDVLVYLLEFISSNVDFKSLAMTHCLKVGDLEGS